MSFFRRIQFQGDDASYIRFLEAKILELESALCLPAQQQVCPQIGRPPISRDVSPPSRHLQTYNEAGDHPQHLKVIEYHPNPANPASGRKTLLGKAKLRWQSNLDDFLAKVPNFENRMYYRDDSVARNREILRVLVRGDVAIHETTESFSRKASKLEGIIPILHQYCDFTVNASPEGEFYRKLACFRELVFVSFCAVALKVVSDTASVYEVMRSYTGSKAQGKHLIKLVRGAIWANRSIFALSKSPWGSKCSDCFFIGMSPHFEIQFYS